MSVLVGLGGALVVLAAGWHLAVGAPARRCPVAPQASPAPAAPPPRRLTRRARDRAIDQCLPDLLDLFVVTVRSGVLPRDALDETGRALAVLHPLLGEAVQAVMQRCQRGERFVDALEHLVEVLGPRALTFVAVVSSTERDGLPLAPSLERLADEAREHRRRTAEAAARELPVRLSLPLVLCTLPSFVLVAIVPLLIGALSSLRHR